ncbi:hypothetical protein MBLNU230_g1077t1 [Neophaeotheca triangularis]
MNITRITFPVCHNCLSAMRQVRSLRPQAAATKARLPRSRPVSGPCFPLASYHSTTKSLDSREQKRSRQRFPQVPRFYATEQTASRTPNPPTGLEAIQYRILDLTNPLLHPTSIALPPEQRIIYVLEQLEAMAKSLLHETPSRQDARPSKSRSDTTATSALLGSVNSHGKQNNPITKQSLLEHISSRAEEIARHPFIFLTPAVLKQYVDLQSLLDRPNSFPDVFELYARKPVPQSSGAGVTYTEASPNKANAAVNPDVANKALETAIEIHDLGLCTSIIETTFATPAHKKSKLIKQALIPGMGLSLAPVAAYTLSQQFSNLQSSALPPETATGIAFAGIMTYVAAVSSMGYIAVTTANDQMDRVTWAQGVPLWERWVREEERRAVDEVAGSWGFADRERRGDEEGVEWEALREWVGKRGMVLDAVELMEGME